MPAVLQFRGQYTYTMDERYRLSTVRYVERNPVAARLCYQPEDWKWSSAGAHLKGEDDRLLSVKPMLDRIDNWRSYLSDENSNNDEELLKLHARTGRPLGDDECCLTRCTGKRECSILSPDNQLSCRLGY